MRLGARAVQRLAWGTAQPQSADRNLCCQPALPTPRGRCLDRDTHPRSVRMLHNPTALSHGCLCVCINNVIGKQRSPQERMKNFQKMEMEKEYDINSSLYWCACRRKKTHAPYLPTPLIYVTCQLCKCLH